jgi:putative copper resistance protein D
MDNFLLLPRALAAAISDSGFAAIFGLVLASLLLVSGGESGLCLKLRRSSLYCAIAMLLAGFAQVYLATATMIGAAAFDAVRGQIMTVALETHAGKALLWNLFLVLILLLTLCVRSDRQWRSTAWLLLAELVALTVVRAGTGHAAANGDFTVSEFVQFCHLMSIAVWAGCVLAGGFLVLPSLLREQRTGDMMAFTRRLSRTVTFALAVVLLSGAYNAYVGLGGSVRPLATTQWGVLLDIKIVLVLAAVGMGAANRRMLGSDRSLSVEQTFALAATVRVEAVVMLAILIVSALLANSPPANPGS